MWVVGIQTTSELGPLAHVCHAAVVLAVRARRGARCIAHPVASSTAVAHAPWPLLPPMLPRPGRPVQITVGQAHHPVSVPLAA